MGLRFRSEAVEMVFCGLEGGFDGWEGWEGRGMRRWWGIAVVRVGA